MKLIEAEALARDLMVTHSVGHLDFAFDRAKRSLGKCLFRRTNGVAVPVKITLSRHYVELLDTDEIRDTILHEIAHAIAGHEAGHGAAWKMIARQVGARPVRCASPSVQPAAPIIGTCPECGATVQNLHRLPQRVYYHGGTCGMRKPLRYTKNGAMLSMAHMPTKYQSEMRRRHP